MNFNPTFNSGPGSMDGMFGLGGGSGSMGVMGTGFGGGGMGLNSTLDGAPAMFPPDGSIFDWGTPRLFASFFDANTNTNFGNQ